MLEILLVVWMCRKMADGLRAKGRQPAGYCTLLVLFWFGGEIVAGLIGMALTNEPIVAYGAALAGAAVGALGAFAIARSRPSLLNRPTGGFPVMPVAVQTPGQPQYPIQ